MVEVVEVILLVGREDTLHLMELNVMVVVLEQEDGQLTETGLAQEAGAVEAVEEMEEMKVVLEVVLELVVHLGMEDILEVVLLPGEVEVEVAMNLKEMLGMVGLVLIH